jgi:hypothetical protein
MRHRTVFGMGVLIGFLVVFATAGCGGGGQDDSATSHYWSYRNLSFSYPGSLSVGSVSLVTAGAQTDCICHAVLPPAGAAPQETHSDRLRFRGDSHSGVVIRVIQTPGSDSGPNATEAPSVTLDAARLLASQIGLPVDPQSQTPYAPKPATVAGRTSAYLAVAKITSRDSPDVSQQTWFVPGADAGEVYVLTCQATKKNAGGIRRACQAIVDSLAVT